MMEKPWILSKRIFAAICAKDVESASQIIDGGFDVDTLITEGKSAISICVERGVTEIAQLLLKRGCSLSLKSSRGDYPLHLAVHNKDIHMVKMLLIHRADVTSVDLLGQTPLHIACQLSAYDIIKALMDRNASEHLKISDKNGRTPFLDACRYATKEVIEYLLPNTKVNVYDSFGESPLLECISNPNTSLEMVSMLLRADADVNWFNFNRETPLLRVLRKLCWLQCVEFKCTTEKYVQIALLLIDNKINLNVKNPVGQSPLHLAVCTGEEVIVRKLLNAGSTVDVKDDMFFTPLFYAIRKNHGRIIDILIQGGSNLASQDWEYAKQNLHMPYALELIENILTICKQVKPLSALCRTAIRNSFICSIEEGAHTLPIPPSVMRYIKLEE